MDELLGTIVSAIEDKKGKNILSLDLRGFDGAVADAFVVCLSLIHISEPTRPY